MPIYDNIRNANPELLNKIIPLQGDLEKPRLGLSVDDVEKIFKNVNCVFHVGASVKFVDPLSSQLQSNLIGTYEIIQLTKQIENLQSFIYVSTAYSQCTKKTVEEVLYESTVSSESMLLLAKAFDSAKLDEMSSIVIGKHPNAYTFTKSLSEDLLRRTASNLPVAIVRPTIVCSSWKEPLPGWTNTLHSLSNFMAAYGLGLAHVLITQPQSVIDVIPADYVVNNMIAAAWEVGTFWSTTEKSIRVYNCGSSHQNPITTRKFEELLDKYDAVMSSNQKVWNRFVILSTNNVLITLMYLIQLPLMYFLDFVSLFLVNLKGRLNYIKKFIFLITVTSHFVKNSWLFRTSNTIKLWNKLDENDKKLFDFNIAAIDWDSVFFSCVKGIRFYSLKESPKTIPKAQFRRHVMKLIHYIYLAFWFLIISYVLVYVNFLLIR